MLFVAVFLFVLCPIVFAWALANSDNEREQLHDAMETLRTSVMDAYRPLLERVARLLSR